MDWMETFGSAVGIAGDEWEDEGVWGLFACGSCAITVR